jgi:hypothetical protein
MLFSNLNRRDDITPLNEGNFISKDITGFFDSDAEFRLSSLTIEKLFEGLDIENSDNMHNYIISNMPSLKDVLGKNKSDDTSAFELLRAQLLYMESKIQQYDIELSSAFSSVIKATKYSKDLETAKEKITKMTGPTGISSVIPKVDQTVLNAKNNGYNFSDPRLRTAFDSLYNIKVLDIIQGVILSLEESAKNSGIKSIYEKIDSFDIKEIEADSGKLEPKIHTNGRKPNTDDLIKSDDVYNRFSGFYEEVLLRYPFGRNMKQNFGDSYEVIINGPLGVRALKQFIPFVSNISLDYTAFEPIETLLDEISAILINRVYADSPYETVKNIFTPAFQMMYAGMLSLLAMKLINYNISAEKEVIAKQEQIKKTVEDTKRNRVIALKASMDTLDSLNFFVSDKVYRTNAVGMNTDIIKQINNFLVNLELLPQTAKDSTNFDEKTADAVKKMQSNHNIQVDGAIGPKTKEVMSKLTKFYIGKYQIA